MHMIYSQTCSQQRTMTTAPKQFQLCDWRSDFPSFWREQYRFYPFLRERDRGEPAVTRHQWLIYACDRIFLDPADLRPLLRSSKFLLSRVNLYFLARKRVLDEERENIW